MWNTPKPGSEVWAVISRDLIETARSLAGCAANLIIGRARKPAWHHTYRALEHGKARNACEDKRPMAAFPQEVRHFAKTFVILQKARQQADYALDGRYSKLDVLAAIDRAERSIARFGRPMHNTVAPSSPMCCWTTSASPASTSSPSPSSGGATWRRCDAMRSARAFVAPPPPPKNRGEATVAAAP